MDDLLAVFGLGRAITLATATIVSVGALFTAPLAAGPPSARRTGRRFGAPALPPEASGEQIYRAACATCHGLDGTGRTRGVVGFALPLPNGHDFPDFTDCSINTVEPLIDWVAVAARGGPVRALDRHMPAFGEALSADAARAGREAISGRSAPTPRGRAATSTCRAPSSPEKAFPENETVWTTGVTGSGQKAVTNELVYEHRIGARGQYEVKVPFTVQQGDGGGWNRGIGDVEVAVRRTFYASHDARQHLRGRRRRHVSNRQGDRGPRQRLHRRRAVRDVGSDRSAATASSSCTRGSRFPPIRTRGRTKASCARRSATRFAQDGGFGRAWSPMAEVIVAKPKGGARRMGRRPAGAGVAQQAAARAAQRRRPRARSTNGRSASPSSSPTFSGTGSTAACSSSGSETGDATSRRPCARRHLHRVAALDVAGRAEREGRAGQTDRRERRPPPSHAGHVALHALRRLRRLPQRADHAIG